MQAILLNLFLLAVGFLLLVKGADYFIDGATSIALKFHIPMIVIGLTVAAFGTSLPEAAISINAAFKENAGISVGNVIGSNILNILLILGLSACITPLTVRKNTIQIEIPLEIGISVLLTGAGALLGELTFFCGILLWILFIAFLVYLFCLTKKGNGNPRAGAGQAPLSTGRSLFCVIIGLTAIVLGSDVAVDSATVIAKYIGVSDRVIGLTVVAFGTSLPELVTSTKAALRGNADIAVGNIVGSNIFNILFVLGTSSLLTPIAFSQKFIIDGIVCVASAVLLYLFCAKKQMLTRKHGLIMLLLYAVYFIYLVMR